ncbi:carboxymuconolactone decarboxylase family protein [Xanthobacter sediminis]
MQQMPPVTTKIASESRLSLAELRAIASDATENLPEGQALDRLSVALVTLGVCVSVTTLDRTAIEDAMDDALAAGATILQIQEVVALASGLGVHSLMVSAVSLLSRAQVLGESCAVAPLDDTRRALWQRHVGDDPFWAGFERELPGFLEALLRLSPEGFVAFFDYCAVPWKSGTVRARTKELIALACDATPNHRFLPGFRLHMNNAIALGVGRMALLQTLDIAGNAPPHEGTR